MNTRALLFALPVLALGLGGCRDNRASVSIHAICTVKAECTFSGKCDTYLAGNPVVDAVTSTSGRLTLFLEAGNQLADNSSKDTFRTNTNDAHVDEIIVDYEGIALPRQVIATQQLIASNSTSVIGIDVIPSSTAAQTALAAYAPTATPRGMTAVVKLGGYWDDGSRWETGEFPISIDVCSNCIPLCAAGAGCGGEGQLPQACN